MNWKITLQKSVEQRLNGQRPLSVKQRLAVKGRLSIPEEGGNIQVRGRGGLRGARGASYRGLRGAGFRGGRGALGIRGLCLLALLWLLDGKLSLAFIYVFVGIIPLFCKLLALPLPLKVHIYLY